MKKGLVIVLSALVLASCGRPQRTVSPKSSDTKQTSTSEKKQSGMDLKAIKAKDITALYRNIDAITAEEIQAVAQELFVEEQLTKLIYE